MALSLHQPPSERPITLGLARTHQHVDETAEDALIELAIDQAVEDAEHIMKRAIMPQQWLLALDEFPSGRGGITLQRPKVQELVSIEYLDWSTARLEVDVDGIVLANASDYTASIHPLFGALWPVAMSVPESVHIVFTCGWLNAAAVPASVKQWILLRVGALFEFRSQWTSGEKIELNPNLDYLLDRWKVITF